MRIATWNVNECVGITCDLGNQQTADEINMNNVEDIATKINENKFDVVCLQEYPVTVKGKEIISQWIAEHTDLKYYCIHDTYNSYLFPGGRVGVAIFSRFRLLNPRLTLFGNPKMAKTNTSGITYYSFDKGIIETTIKTHEKTYTVITGHAIAFAPFGKSEFDYPE